MSAAESMDLDQALDSESGSEQVDTLEVLMAGFGDVVSSTPSHKGTWEAPEREWFTDRSQETPNVEGARRNDWLDTKLQARFLGVRPAIRHRRRPLQQWEGTVVEVNGDEFTARLRDLTDPSHVEERATFLLSQVTDDDIDLVKVGGVFYWYIGNRIEHHGQKSMFSELRFRRLPAWTKQDVQRVAELASDLEEFFQTTDDGDEEAAP